MSVDLSLVRFPSLNDTNYWEWALRMEALLVKKKLWKVVQPNLTPPKSTSKEDEESWVKAQLAGRDADLMAEARAEIVEKVETSQLVHVRDSDPRIVWQTLAEVHIAKGFATRLSLRREFLRLKKAEDETMTAWISRVKTLAYRLKDAGVHMEDEDQILALTNGLGPSFESFVISLDATPDSDMSLPHVVRRLLNEEVRRRNDETRLGGGGEQRALVTAGLSMQGRSRQGTPSPGAQPSGPPSCWKCGKSGHIRAYCNEVPTQGTQSGAANLTVSQDDHLDDDRAIRSFELGHTII